jgi:Lipase (class 3)
MRLDDEQVMLTLAGLTYRGFHDLTRGGGHARRVADAVEAGLRTLPPVAGTWELVWGPVTSRGPDEHVDTNAMYVARHAHERHRYAVAIRGTNPISLSDWLFGDFWVNAVVPWPWAPAGAGVATSASTALGLGALQRMRAQPATAAAGRGAAAVLGQAASVVARTGVAAVGRLDEALAHVRSTLRAHLAMPMQKWLDAADSDRLAGLLREASVVPQPLPEILRPRPGAPSTAEPDLLTFLAAQAAETGTALDVSVTGHSKGAALAQAVALWLREALDVPAERWDAERGARIQCYGFACPTAGNAAFARRFEDRLGATHHQVRNLHDVVPHAWQVDQLERVPALFGPRTAVFEPVVGAIVAKVAPLDYRHVEVGVRPIHGQLVGSRSVALEFAHQHLDAYLDQLGLDAHGIDALTLFVG